jgi:hypothetical protein
MFELAFDSSMSDRDHQSQLSSQGNPPHPPKRRFVALLLAACLPFSGLLAQRADTVSTSSTSRPAAEWQQPSSPRTGTRETPGHSFRAEALPRADGDSTVANVTFEKPRPTRRGTPSSPPTNLALPPEPGPPEPVTTSKPSGRTLPRGRRRRWLRRRFAFRLD